MADYVLISGHLEGWGGDGGGGVNPRDVMRVVGIPANFKCGMGDKIAFALS